MTIVWEEHLLHLPDEVRAVVLPEFIEEVRLPHRWPPRVVPCYGPCYQ